MYLFDSITPPLEDGSYRLTVETNVSSSGATPTFSQQHYFDIVGPRFSVPPALVAGCFPPNNGHGVFQDDLPHIVLSRRTLPWERELDPEGRIPASTVNPADPPSLDRKNTPWVALLLFEEGEYTLYRNIPLEQAVPADVFQRLGSPANITCDAVEAGTELISAILPSVEELQLLAHGRWVNVDDRELNTAGGDGFFSVVVANRLPSPGAQCRAVLVSLEERSDLVQADPPPTATPVNPPIGFQLEAKNRLAPTAETVAVSTSAASTLFTLSNTPVDRFSPDLPPLFGCVVEGSVRLVALTSWQFTCEGPGPFRKLMQKLDDAMFGTVAKPGHPALTDTGHLELTLQDRLGAREGVWYRGPLVPYNLTRDDLGPYHSADQARRVTPETGAEDISYAAAFELGRLLAAADPRLAQALMRWRRESYKQSARASTIAAIAEQIPLGLPPTLAERLHTPIAPIVATAATVGVVQSSLPIADAYGLEKVAGAPGMDATQLAVAWHLSSPQEATALLGGDAGTLGAVVTPPLQTVRSDTTLEAVASNPADLERLSAARSQVVDNATTTLEDA